MLSTDPVLGLKTKEELILSALSSGDKNVSEIARATKIPRTSLLYILTKLKERTLVEDEPKGKSVSWKLIKQDILDIRSVGSSKNDISISHGAPALLDILNKLVDLPKNSRVQGIQPDISLRNAIKKNSLDDLLRINTALKEHKLIFEGIVHEKSVDTIMADMGKHAASKIFESFIGRLEDYVKIPDEFANVNAEMYIFKGVAYILNWEKEIAIIVNNRDMVALLQAMFSCVKELGIRYSQNEKMKAKIKK